MLAPNLTSTLIGNLKVYLFRKKLFNVVPWLSKLELVMATNSAKESCEMYSGDRVNIDCDQPKRSQNSQPINTIIDWIDDKFWYFFYSFGFPFLNFFFSLYLEGMVELVGLECLFEDVRRWRYLSNASLPRYPQRVHSNQHPLPHL